MSDEANHWPLLSMDQLPELALLADGHLRKLALALSSEG
jgi:hypothetical protein